MSLLLLFDDDDEGGTSPPPLVHGFRSRGAGMRRQGARGAGLRTGHRAVGIKRAGRALAAAVVLGLARWLAG